MPGTRRWLADSFANADVVPVIDDVVVLKPHLDFYRESVRTQDVKLVVLAPDPAVANARNRAREKVLVDAWSFLDEAMRGEIPGEGVWIDNAAQTVEQTVEEILARCGVVEVSGSGPA